MNVRNAIARAQADAARGDLGSDRRRLASLVNSGSYDPEALTLVAGVCQKMQDPLQAGRYWLLSPATGPEVDQAIEMFARACHRDARVMASQLPRFRMRHSAVYPAIVQERLARHGLDAVFGREEPEWQGPRWKVWLAPLGCLAVAALLALLIVGALRMTRGWWCG